MFIDDLANRAELIPTLARWHLAQWAYLNPGDALERRITRLQNHCGDEAIPTTFVACAGATPLGSASLVAHDMDTHPELSPWLASMYVAPEFRRQGIGSALVRRVGEEARKLGHQNCYLFTPDRDAFYAQLGWRIHSREAYRGEIEIVMELDLSSR